ncbi:presequence protease, mitochondrial [Chrysoperla carnea]|uniref:presequence protease, mitochondrial n=1 Tax=Chrysoperla carnea TaxID=189513 RepID=UPI001D06D1AD|nr:presequence protease, mitochondrial [Chrysoperla carnea]
MFKHNLKGIMRLQIRNFHRNLIRSYVTKVSTKTKITPPVTQREKYIVGKVYSGFKVTNIEPITEFSMEAIHFEHEKTGAEYLHLYRDDANNVFSINFRTTPRDNSGKPHILEHTVLCGSEKYPIKDPFFKMLNRSLATFMNAMTAPDYTMYPFSTTNEKDFRNLQSVYLDAVFNPKLKLSDFMQEGWRLEQKDLNDPHSEIIIKGVVYNEMKGVLAENERIIGEKLLNMLLPDHTYGVISGGDPLAIPDLTWEGLKNFHRVHYHPSNSKFFSYGNFPVQPTLEYINENYLKNYSKIDTKHTAVPSQTRWNEPRRAEIRGRFSEIGQAKQHSLVIGYLMNDITDVYSTLVMQFISELLVKGVNSPFYKSLIEPNFSGGYSTQTGYDSQIKDTIFVLGLQSVEEKDYDKILRIFDETIDDVVKKGFDPEQIENILHGYELGIKHESTNFGLRLLFNLSPLLNHNADILKSLKVNELIGRLKKDIADHPDFLQKTVAARFQHNRHKLILSLKPDVNYDKELNEAEKKLLESKVANIDGVRRREIFELSKTLQEEQKKPQPMEILPTLVIDDILKKTPPTNASIVVHDRVPIQICEVPTNGITYLKMLIDTSKIKDNDHKMLIPVFNYVISRLGTKKYNYREFDTLIHKKTSGLSISTHIAENLNNIDEFQQGISLSSYCLDSNLEDMLNIWNEIFSIETLNDVKQFELLVKLYVTNLTNGIADSGHAYAMSSANSMILGSCYQQEVLSGLAHIKYMKQLVKDMNCEDILKKIQEMAAIVFNKQNLRVAFNCLPENRNQVLSKVESFISQLPGAQNSETNRPIYKTVPVFEPQNGIECKHHSLNIPVYFASKAVKGVSYTDEKFAHLRILARLITAKYLFPAIREAGGAYGAGARCGSNGAFTFFSYRDPSHFQTLKVFDETHQYVENKLKDLTDQDIFEAKLNVFQAIDAPIIPASKGNSLFYSGLTDEMLQKHRETLLGVNKNNLYDVSQEFLSSQSTTKMAKVILGPSISNFDKEVKSNEHWTVEKTDTS